MKNYASNGMTSNTSEIQLLEILETMLTLPMSLWPVKMASR